MDKTTRFWFFEIYGDPSTRDPDWEEIDMMDRIRLVLAERGIWTSHQPDNNDIPYMRGHVYFTQPVSYDYCHGLVKEAFWTPVVNQSTHNVSGARLVYMNNPVLDVLTPTKVSKSTQTQ